MKIKEIRLHNFRKLASDFATMEQFAEACGYEGGNYFRQLASGYRDIGDRTARKIEKARNRPEGWLDVLRHAPTADVMAAPEEDYTEGPDLLPLRRCPIVGEVMGGVDGYLEEYLYPPGEDLEYLAVPTRDPHCYTVRVRGDSMRPRIKPGEYLAVNGSMEAQPGQDVVIKLKDGRKMVKELVFIRDDEVEFHSINDGSRLTVPLSLIICIHPIAGIFPRGSAFKK